MRPVILVISLNLAASCGEFLLEDPPPPPPIPEEAPRPTSPEKLPPQLELVDEYNTGVIVADLPFGRCSGLLRGLHLKFGCQIYIYPFTLEVPGATVMPTKTAGDEERELSLLAAFGRLPVDSKLDEVKLDPDTTATVVFKNGKKLSGKLPAVKASRHDIVKDLHERSAKGFRFSKDEPTPAKHSMIHLSTYDLEVVGPAKRFEETDWIAVGESTERDTSKMCNGYQVDGSSKLVSLSLTAVDITLTVRDRASGRVLHTKKFESDMHCPAMAYGGLSAGPDAAQMRSWLRSLL
jgi:hypothetical protein